VGRFVSPVDERHVNCGKQLPRDQILAVENHWETVMLYCRCLAVLLLAVLAYRNELPGRENAGASQAATQITEKAKDVSGDMIMSCAKACSDCQRACDACSAHCVGLLSEGKTQHVKTMQLCNDCAAICAASAQIVARHGPMTNVVCTACADACNQCAAACEVMKDDAHMKHCAEECRRCEKSCRTMTGQATERKN
jgi:hypothetical protein